MSRFRVAHWRPVVLVAALFASLASVAAPMPAQAHAELVTATPAPNGSVATPPERVSITFSEAVDPESVSIEVLDAQQRPVEGVGAPSVSADGLTAIVTLPNLDPAVYTVSYQVVSVVDGHATAGIYAFLIDPTGAAPPPADSARATSPSVDPLTVAGRWLALAAILVALGSLVLWWTAARPVLAERDAPDRPPWILVGATALLGGIGIAAYLLLAARPITTPGTGIPLDVAGAFGWTPFAVAMRVALLLAIGVSIVASLSHRGRLSDRAAAVAAMTGLVAATGAMSLAAHAASYGGPVFAAIDAAHLLAVAGWLGGLPAALLLASRAHGRRGEALGAILRRHGSLALIAAPLVALTGIANSPLVLGSARDVVASDYGNLIVAKALLLAVAVGIGAANHLALRGRGRVALRSLVAAELVVGALAVVAAATMVTIQPSAARQPVLAAPPVKPAHFFGEVGPSRVHLAVSLPAPGTQAYRVTVLDRSTGLPRADVQKVFLVFTPPAEADLPAERIEVPPDATDGLWTASGAYTPLVGTWEVDVVVRRQGARDERLAFDLDVLDAGASELGPPPDTGITVPATIGAMWALLPRGPAAWLPVLGALVVLAGLWPARRRRAISIARGTAFGVLVLATVAAGSRTLVDAANAPVAVTQPAASPPAEIDLERGHSVYLANCASCHGVEGDGSGPIAPIPAAGPLGDAVRRTSERDLSYRIAYGVAGTSMPAFAGELTAAERADLIGYLRDRFGGQ